MAENQSGSEGVSRRVFMTTSGVLAVGALGAGAIAGALPAFAEPDDPSDPVPAPALLTGDPSLCGSRDDHGPRDSLWLDVKDATVLHPQSNILVAHPDPISFPYALRKGGGEAYNLLTIPTRRIKGIECPTIWEPTATNMWLQSWQQAESHLKLQSHEINLGINSARGRQKDQLHIHLARLKPVVRTALNGLSNVTSDHGQWANSQFVVDGHAYRILHVSNLDRNLFALLNDQVSKFSASDMASQILSVATAPGGYYVLNSDGLLKTNNVRGTSVCDVLFQFT